MLLVETVIYRISKYVFSIRTECDQNMSGGIGHEMDDNDIDDNDNNGAVGFDMNDPLIGFDDNWDVDMAAGILSNWKEFVQNFAKCLI